MYLKTKSTTSPETTPVGLPQPFGWRGDRPWARWRTELSSGSTRLYVPLLHAASADLTPSALQAWRANPCDAESEWWEHAHQLLAASTPEAPIAALTHTAETTPSTRAPSTLHSPILLGASVCSMALSCMLVGRRANCG